jgi:hypothetical protein
LLLPAGEARAGAREVVFDFIPERDLAQRLFDHGLRVLDSNAVQSQTREDVVADRHRGKGVRLLENHADTPANAHRIHVALVNVLSVEQHLALRLRMRNDLVHPIQTADERGFAAPRRTDHGRDPALCDRQIDAAQDLGAAERRA